jgi:hypothetical protein
MSPARDGVMRDVEIVKIFHEFGELVGWDGLKDGEVKDQRDRGFIKGHFGPGEFDGDIRLDAIDRIRSDVKRFAWQGDVKFVSAAAVIFVNIIITTQAITIG